MNLNLAAAFLCLLSLSFHYWDMRGNLREPILRAIVMAFTLTCGIINALLFVFPR